ncbi:MAG: glycosyltransferase family 4 protein [Chloroflexaceae bacterium]|nr:glycosyltransferase family 4 protein [Chloroflexaceae bacterium]
MNEHPSPPTHVLMVAYIYPPNRIVTGSRRIIKFAKYLPGFGYRPVILTTVRTGPCRTMPVSPRLAPQRSVWFEPMTRSDCSSTSTRW